MNNFETVLNKMKEILAQILENCSSPVVHLELAPEVQETTYTLIQICKSLWQRKCIYSLVKKVIFAQMFVVFFPAQTVQRGNFNNL